MTVPQGRRYAGELLGLTLKDGWKVVEHMPSDPKGTGGFWSEGYFVEREGAARAFLKAIDLSSAYAHADVMRTLQSLTEAYNDEISMLERCRTRGLNRVVVAIDHGEVFLLEPGNTSSYVPYIIFECADGDVRRHINLSREFDIRWALRGAAPRRQRDTAVAPGTHRTPGLKPSNVMMFDQGSSAKVGDLGRASQPTKAGQWDHWAVPGNQG